MMLISRYSLSRDPKSAIFCNLGIALGLLIHSILASLGIAALLMADASLYTILKIIGALYLVYLGVQSLRSSGILENISKAQKPDYKKAFRQGFLTNLLNVKVMIFILVLFTQVIDPDYSINQQSIFVVVLILSSFLFWSALTIAIRRPAIFKFLKKNETRLNMVFGSLLILFGLILAVAP